MADPPPPQNSAHLDGQNTDLSDNTLTITAPEEAWSDNSALGADELSMKGVGLGIAVVEFREGSGGGGILATPYNKVTGNPAKYFLRYYNYDSATPVWDFPTGTGEYFTGLAALSVPVVDSDKNIYYGDNTKIVKLYEDEGEPVLVATYAFNSKGAPHSFHLCDDDFLRVVTVTSEGYVFLIYGEGESDNLLVYERELNDGEAYKSSNTVGISNDGSFAYVTTVNGMENKNRLYAIAVTGDGLPLESNMPRLTYPSSGTFAMETKSDASPLVREVNGGYYIYYDVMMEVGETAVETIVCAFHDTTEEEITEVWTTATPNGNNIVCSFA